MLNHGNIVTIFDVGEDHELAYIAMEYLPGKDLSAYTRKNNLLTIEEILNIGISCANALDYSHKAGVVHRDIKPSNIIYHRESQRVWITEFGIALILDAEKTSTSSSIGSPSYMSPEQVKGEALDGRSDIYSLGVTLFQLLAAQKPFSRGEVSALTYSIVHNPTPELISVKADVPQKLSDLIFKAMQKDKENRFATAAEMREMLQRCTDSDSPS